MNEQKMLQIVSLGNAIAALWASMYTQDPTYDTYTAGITADNIEKVYPLVGIDDVVELFSACDEIRVESNNDEIIVTATNEAAKRAVAAVMAAEIAEAVEKSDRAAIYLADKLNMAIAVQPNMRYWSIRVSVSDVVSITDNDMRPDMVLNLFKTIASNVTLIKDDVYDLVFDAQDIKEGIEGANE